MQPNQTCCSNCEMQPMLQYMCVCHACVFLDSTIVLCDVAWTKLCKSFLSDTSAVTHMGLKALTHKVGYKNHSWVQEKMTILGAMTFFCALAFVTSAMNWLLNQIVSGAFVPICSVPILMRTQSVTVDVGQLHTGNNTPSCELFLHVRPNSSIINNAYQNINS